MKEMTEKEEQLMLEKVQSLERMVKAKFAQYKDDNIVWNVKNDEIGIMFNGTFTLAAPLEFILEVERIMQKKVLSIQVKNYNKNKTVVLINMEHLFKNRNRLEKANPFNNEIWVKDPITLKIIREEKKQNFRKNHAKFLKKVEGGNKFYAPFKTELLLDNSIFEEWLAKRFD